MNNIKTQLRRWGWRVGVALIVGVFTGTLSACDDLLDVDLPDRLTDQALEDPAGADSQVNSIIALFECAYSTNAWYVLGKEDVIENIAGVASGSHMYYVFSPTGGCDSESEDNDWWDDLSSSRAMAFDLYDRLENEWTVEQVPQKERFQAVSSIYAAASLEWMGEVLCETTVDAGQLMTPEETLGVAEEWADRALQHISSTGDFALRNDISSSAEQMARGLRARIRFYKGDFTGALADAEQVSEGFVAYVTRENGPQRRNKVYDAATAVAFGRMQGMNDWWSGPPNPVTGEEWPSPIPFTGYIFLGIQEDDGRAVHDDGTPVRWAEEERGLNDPPTPLGNGAVPDTRVPHEVQTLQGPGSGEMPAKYESEEDDIPFVNWKEMWLIRAAVEGGQAAIDRVNELRAADGLPLVTYADPSDDQEIRYMITEEWRRALWLEGRYYPYKIQNTDLLWFPRAVGETPFQGYSLNGAVRMLMPNSEFTLNENLRLEDRGTGCDPSQQPIF